MKYAKMSTEANHVVHEGKLKKGSIVRLKSYQANSVKGKRLDFFPKSEIG